MDNLQPDPFLGQPPARRSYVWLWITAVLACLICALLISLSLPVGGILLLMTQTAHANVGAARGAEFDVAATDQAGATLTAEALLAQPPPGWKMVIYDAFDSNQYGWDTETHQSPQTVRSPSIKYGRYVYHIDYLSLGGLFIERPSELRETQPDRFFLAVEARQLGESTADDTYGLVFRQKNSDTYALFEINNKGKACVLTLGDLHKPADTPCASERSITAGKFNRLVIYTEQESYLFIVNDHVIGRVKDLPMDKGRVGIFASATSSEGITFEFDNFQLYVPPQ